MKVAIITILDNTNYGTYLQALATGLIIKKLGHEVEIIRYIRPCMTPKGHSMTILKERGFVRWFYRCVLKSRAHIWELRKKDYDFLSQYLPVTQEFVGSDSLQSDPPSADIYMTGSDQVWNSIYNQGMDKSFFLDFGAEETKRIAYAASIGMDTIPVDEIQEMTRLLKRYHTITVREKKAHDLLSQIGIASTVVSDPTLLLTHKDWKDIMKEPKIEISEPFLLVYCVELREQAKLIKYYALSIARIKNIKIFAISYGNAKKEFPWADRWFSYATPDIFLQLIDSAAYCVVSSFHGTAFSINFNKPFLTIAPARFNSRVLSLLNAVGLENHLVTDKDYDLYNLPDIDYHKINSLLESLRILSINTLIKMIES